MKRIVGAVAVMVAALLVSMPVAVVVTIVLFPLWSLIEDRFGIESVGHSGPAGWCFLVTYVVVAVPVCAFVARLLLRGRRSQATG